MIHFLTFHYHFLPKYILPDTQPAHLFLNHLHCKWNNSGFLSGITKWFYHTMLHTHGYNWWKFEDLTPTSLDSTEHQNVCNLMWKVLYPTFDLWCIHMPWKGWGHAQFHACSRNPITVKWIGYYPSKEFARVMDYVEQQYYESQKERMIGNRREQSLSLFI